MKKPINITPQMVCDFWRHMGAEYGFQIIDKGNSRGMKVVAEFLDKIGVLSSEKFLEDFTTTIGNRVYVPFKIGRGTQLELLHQFVVCAHEAAHVNQWRDSPVEFMAKYIACPTDRAHYEAEALAVNMELMHYLTGRTPSSRGLASSLMHYAIGKKDIATVRQHLAMISETVSWGGYSSPVTREAIRWLKERQRSWFSRFVRRVFTLGRARV